MKKLEIRWFCYLTLVSILLVGACKKKKNDSTIQTCVYVPSTIDTTIDLKDHAFYDLETKGYAYGRAGSRRIIIHKESETKYTAFDRASSYKMAEVGCLLKVDPSSFFLLDTCSGSKFDFEGNVIQDPANCPLLEFQVSFIGNNELRITHTP